MPLIETLSDLLIRLAQRRWRNPPESCCGGRSGPAGGMTACHFCHFLKP